MTVPFERTRALIQTKEFLEAMMDPRRTPRTPKWMRGKAKSLLRHYPGLAEIEAAHKALPDEFGPVPPFSRLSGGGTTLAAVDAAKQWDDLFNDGPAVSEDFGSTNMRCTECIFEHYPLEGDDVFIGIFCKRCGQPRLPKKMNVSELIAILNTMPPDAVVLVPGLQAEFYDALRPDEVRLELAAEISELIAHWFDPTHGRRAYAVIDGDEVGVPAVVIG